MPNSSEQLDTKKNTLRNRLLTAGSVLAVGSLALTGCSDNESSATPVPTETSTSVETTPSDAELLETDPQAYITEKVLNREELSQEEWDALTSVYEQAVESPLMDEIAETNANIIISGMTIPGAQDVSWVNDKQDKVRMANLSTLGEVLGNSINTITIPEELQDEDAFLEEARRVYAYSLTKYAHDELVDLETFNELYLPENGKLDVDCKEWFIENAAWNIVEKMQSDEFLDDGMLQNPIADAIQIELTERSLGENLPSQLDLEVTASSINGESLGEGLSYWAGAKIGNPGNAASYENYVIKVKEQTDGTDRITGIVKRAQ